MSAKYLIFVIPYFHRMMKEKHPKETNNLSLCVSYQILKELRKKKKII